MKYSTVFDKKFRHEDQETLPAFIIKKINGSEKLLRTRNTDIFEPVPQELSQATSAEVDECMRRTEFARPAQLQPRHARFFTRGRMLAIAVVIAVIVGVAALHTLHSNAKMTDCIAQYARIMEEAKSAARRHDASALFAFAQQCQALEAGALNSKHAPGSKTLYKMAALFAVSQKQSTLLARIIAQNNDLNEYPHFSVATRGAVAQSLGGFPRLVDVPTQEWKTLKEDEYPLWRKEVANYFTKQSSEDIVALSEAVNNALQFNDPVSLAKCAGKISDIEMADTPRPYRAETLFALAVDMACAFEMTEQLAAVTQIYSNSTGYRKNVLLELESELKVLKARRGQRKVPLFDENELTHLRKWLGEASVP